MENYKGWDITLNWDDETFSVTNPVRNNSYNQKEKWKGVNISGKSIYGSSLKEIRHIIDYPRLYEKPY